MLVLTRKKGEQVVIDGGIVVTVLRVGDDGRVRLGFTAPREVRIFREEVAPHAPPGGGEPPEATPC